MSEHRITENVSTKFQRIAELACKDQNMRFTSLAHLLTPEYLQANLRKLKKRSAPGVDGMTVEEFKSSESENIEDLYNRLRAGQYRASPVLRKYIPKSNNKQRPLGIPTVEDRIVQKSVAGIIGTIYEPYFCEFSYGFRPQRSCHDALEKLRCVIDRKEIGYVVDADIKGYFDNVNHQWVRKFLSHRIADSTILRLIGKWLRSGIMEKGVLCRNEDGTPQGGPISPLLANIYLHYVLDLWFEKRFKKMVKGKCELVRYADDFVVCFQYRHEAEMFLKELGERFEKFHLELSEEKTCIVEFGKKSKQNGQTGPTGTIKSFDFLGFTHYMRKKGKRGFRVARKPCIKSRNKFLRNIRNFIRKHRDRSVWWQAYKLKAKLQGYYNYFGLRYCKPALCNIKWHTEWVWICELRKRSQRHNLQWSRMRRYPWFKILPEPKLR